MSQQINLFNPLFLRREKHFSGVTIFWSLFALSFTLGVYCAYLSYSIRATEERARYFESMVKYKRSEMADTTARYSPEGRNKQLEANVRTLESQLASRLEIWRAVNSLELGTGSGFADYLQAFSRRAVAGVWLTGFSIGGGAGDLTIRGRVLRPELVSVFLSAIGQEEIMRGRKVVELSLVAPLPAVQAGTSAPSSAAGEPTIFVEFSVRAPADIPESSAPASGNAPTQQKALQ